MDIIKDLLLNYYFLSIIIAWVLSILIKSALVAVRKKKMVSISEGFHNGGMPSSHSAAVSAISVAILLTEGFSALFFVSSVFAAIVISDAFRLRKNVGLQGEQLNILLQKSKEKTINIIYGHTVLQVIVGIIIGIIVPIILLSLIQS